MLKIKRDNVILRINDTDKDYYMAKGFSVIDEDGNVLEASKNNDELESLKKQNEEYVNKISELEAELMVMKNLLEEMSKPKEEEVQEEVVVEEPVEEVQEEEIEVEEKPKKRSKK